MSHVITVVMPFDDPECGGAADALCDQLQREADTLARHKPSVPLLNIRPLAVVQGGSHRDALFATLQELYQMKPETIYVIALLKGNNYDEFKKIKELCQHNRNIPNNVVTHLSSYNDVGLIVRNAVRTVLNILDPMTVAYQQAM